MKETQEKLNILHNPSFCISDTQFKAIVSSSLPESWDTFTDAYIGSRRGTADNMKEAIKTQEFIGILKEEYIRRKSRHDGEHSRTVQQTYQSTLSSTIQPLVDRLKVHSTNNNNMTPRCKNCNLMGHTTDDCKWLGQVHCHECNWFGHIARDCHRKGQGKRKPFNPKENDKRKKKKTEQTNKAQENSEGNASFSNNEYTFAVIKDDSEDYNFDTYNVSDINANDEHVSYYDWVADTTTTSHIVNSKDAFTSYKPLERMAVSGVGNSRTLAEGRGIVELESNFNG